MNHMQTLMVFATLAALLVWAGTALAGQNGFVMALVLAGVLSVGAYGGQTRQGIFCTRSRPPQVGHRRA